MNGIWQESEIIEKQGTKVLNEFATRRFFIVYKDKILAQNPGFFPGENDSFAVDWCEKVCKAFPRNADDYRDEFLADDLLRTTILLQPIEEIIPSEEDELTDEEKKIIEAFEKDKGTMTLDIFLLAKVNRVLGKIFSTPEELADYGELLSKHFEDVEFDRAKFIEEHNKRTKEAIRKQKEKETIASLKQIGLKEYILNNNIEDYTEFYELAEKAGVLGDDVISALIEYLKEHKTIEGFIEKDEVTPDELIEILPIVESKGFDMASLNLEVIQYVVNLGEEDGNEFLDSLAKKLDKDRYDDLYTSLALNVRKEEKVITLEDIKNCTSYEEFVSMFIEYEKINGQSEENGLTWLDYLIYTIFYEVERFGVGPKDLDDVKEKVMVALEGKAPYNLTKMDIEKAFVTKARALRVMNHEPSELVETLLFSKGVDEKHLLDNLYLILTNVTSQNEAEITDAIIDRITNDLSFEKSKTRRLGHVLAVINAFDKRFETNFFEVIAENKGISIEELKQLTNELANKQDVKEEEDFIEVPDEVELGEGIDGILDVSDVIEVEQVPPEEEDTFSIIKRYKPSKTEDIKKVLCATVAAVGTISLLYMSFFTEVNAVTAVTHICKTIGGLVTGNAALADLGAKIGDFAKYYGTALATFMTGKYALSKPKKKKVKEVNIDEEDFVDLDGIEAIDVDDILDDEEVEVEDVVGHRRHK